MKPRSVIICFIVLCCTAPLYAQPKMSDEEKKCYDLLEGSLGKYLESDNMAVYFENIAYKLKEPEKIYTLPVYQVYKGGYMLSLGTKYEIQLGNMKALCDGKLCVLIEETQKVMYVDSIKHMNITDTSMVDMEQVMNESINDAKMTDLGEVVLNGKKCHKIKTTFNGKLSGHVLYYIEKESKQLLLMAEYQDNAYTVYQFNKITKVPAGHEFAIQLPKKELQRYYGYTVIDNRYLTIEK